MFAFFEIFTFRNDHCTSEVLHGNLYSHQFSELDIIVEDEFDNAFLFTASDLHYLLLSLERMYRWLPTRFTTEFKINDFWSVLPYVAICFSECIDMPI